MPAAVRRVVERIGENCEPSLCTVLFLGGAGGSLRAGVTENPVLLTRAIKHALVNVTCGGAPAYVWPGGGITVMVDVARMPDNSFGTVPTPAIVAPIEFSMRLDDYRALGGHMDRVRRARRASLAARGRRWRAARRAVAAQRAVAAAPPRGTRADGATRRDRGAMRAPLDAGRWHFQHGPIDHRRAPTARRGASPPRIERAWRASRTVLDELVAELPLLRAACRRGAPRRAARRDRAPHVAACRPHARDGRFITPMAAVAGASPRS